MENITTMHINEILSELMFAKRIKMIELAHQTGVPQSTLSRILAGATTQPHRSSLEPLAAFFRVSVNQLVGKEPIPSLQRLSLSASQSLSVPLLTWAQVDSWITLGDTTEAYEMVQVDKALGEGSFAVTVEDAAMEPQFSRGAILIVDAKRTAKDRSFVIVKLGKSDKIVFRQLITDGINFYLRSLSPDFSQCGMTTMTDDDNILGVVLQVRKDYLE